MNVYYDLQDLPPFKNAVLTIGSFDGVHRGHQKILEKINVLATKYLGESIVVTFHPHPRLVIYPKDKSLRLLTSIEEKIALFERFGVDHVVVIPFTVAFSQQEADEYIEKFLVGKFQPKAIVIGYDHRFGLNRKGNIDFIKYHAKNYDFEVVEIEEQEVEEITVSSTKIRTALQQGDVKKAARLMGHYFTLTGQVVYGQQIGSTIGFPTANLSITSKQKLLPPDGIYAVYVYHKEQQYEGMLYIGHRPSIKDENQRSIEVNIFNFNQQIYGDTLKLELVDFIREDKTFEGLEALKEQLRLDEKQVKNHLAKLKQVAQKTQATQASTASVAIVILNYNGKEHLRAFLPTVLQTTYTDSKIYVADNASTDDSVQFLKAQFPEIKVLELTENYGFAEGYNQALQQVEADYFVLLNSDVAVTPNWIAPIIGIMENDADIAICQPKILSYQQPTYFEHAGAAGGFMDRFNYPFCRGRIFDAVEIDEGQYNSVQEVFWCSGAAFFIRSKLYLKIGGFEGYFFAHLEEIDLCWRLKRAGYKVMIQPKSVVYHLGGGALNYGSPRKSYLNFRNSLYTIVRNEKEGKVFGRIFARLLLDGVAGIVFLLKGEFKHIGSIFRAHWHFFPKVPQLMRERSRVKDQIREVRIQDEPNLVGKYKSSIVWQYYVNGKKKFSDLSKQ
ncbi:MAG: bifunctional riboflavin kinase/FAD synthetase [Bacteroidota bacterium]